MSLYVTPPSSTPHNSSGAAQHSLGYKGPCAAMVNGPRVDEPGGVGVQPEVPFEGGWVVPVQCGGVDCWLGVKSGGGWLVTMWLF